MSIWAVLLIFAVTWGITFLPAWHLLLWLIAFASTNKRSLGSLRFIFAFVAYRVVIVLPYVVLLVLGGDELPGLIQSFIIGLVVTALLLSLARFFLAQKTEKILWYLYGFAYDGLLHFYPYKLLLSEVYEYSNMRAGQRVLDLGCGTGNFSQLILNKHPGLLVDSVDSSKTMLSKARTKLNSFRNVNVVDSDVLEFLRQSKTEVYDRVVLINVVYAVPDRSALWKELMRTLKKNGLLVFTTSDRKGSWPIIQEHVKNSGWLNLLRPKLILVFVIDAFISKLASVGQFQFQPLEVFASEVSKHGGRVLRHKRCYGGDRKGVNVLAVVARD